MKSKIEISEFKRKALHWATQFEVCCFLDSNGYEDKYGAYDFIIAAGVKAECKGEGNESINELHKFRLAHKSWSFGYLGYDLKNETEQLKSENLDGLNFDDLYFFVPEYVITCKNNLLKVVLGSQQIIEEIELTSLRIFVTSNEINLQNRISEAEYIKSVERLKQHILKGDIYEVNFCQEFFAENAEINPLNCFEELNHISPNPFAGFLKIYDKFILSASPERFICKRKDKLIAQPIKGTIKRSKDVVEDIQLKQDLQGNIKERAENVMIVDLTRNDLTKICNPASVNVAELFKIYSFPQVHQMISTVTGECDANLNFAEIMKHIFPMGSMTGAPKVSAMRLIEETEKTKRGTFSGSMGYITPENEFDFNVIIRSILYNATSKYLSFQVGGAITFLSDPKEEFKECMLKATAMFNILKKKVT